LFCPKTKEVTDLGPQTLYNEEFIDSFVLRAIVSSEIYEAAMGRVGYVDSIVETNEECEILCGRSLENGQLEDRRAWH